MTSISIQNHPLLEQRQLRLNKNNLSQEKLGNNIPVRPQTQSFFPKSGQNTCHNSPNRTPSTWHVMTAFRQDYQGNCASVAAIKAAMIRFGEKPENIFASVTRAGDGFNVEMRDGFRLHLTGQELQQATDSSGFLNSNYFDPEILKNANFLFAVSAKREQIRMQQQSGYPYSYTDALNKLNTGEYSVQTFRNLGLENQVFQSDLPHLRAGKLGVAERNHHAVVVANGREELYGTVSSPPSDPNGNYIALT